MPKRPSYNSKKNDAKKQKTDKDEMKKLYEIQELDKVIVKLKLQNESRSNPKLIAFNTCMLKELYKKKRDIENSLNEQDEDEEEQEKDMGRSEMMEIIYKKNKSVVGIPNEVKVHTEQQQTDNNNNDLRKQGGRGRVTRFSKIQSDRTRELLHVNPKDLGKQDIHGDTVFHYLAKYSQRIDFDKNDIIELFNQNQTLLDMFNKHGQTPRDVYEASNYGKVRDSDVTELFEKGKRFLDIFNIRLQNFQTELTEQHIQDMQVITRSCTLDQWLSPCALCRCRSSYLDYTIILYKQNLRYITNYFLINQCVQINDSFRDIPWIGTPNALKEILKHIILMQVIYDIENNTDHYKHIANVFFTFYKKTKAPFLKKIAPCLYDGIVFYNSLIQQGIYKHYDQISHDDF